MTSSSSSSFLVAEETRPGSDPLRPHQDLRIPSRVPSQYLSQLLPSSSNLSVLSTPPVAVQIASLHRAAEVARFEWRVVQERITRQSVSNQHVLSNAATAAANHASRPNQPVAQTDGRSHSTSPRQAQRATSAAAAPMSSSSNMQGNGRDRSRIFSSSLEAYLSAAREVSRTADANTWDEADEEEIDDIVDDISEDSSVDSDDTQDEVIASTLRPSHERRRDSNTQIARPAGSSPGNRIFISESVMRGPTLSSTHTLPEASHSAAQAFNTDVAGDIRAEGQVWDRMVEDLAIGAGVSVQSRNSHYPFGISPYSRGIGGGIAASMLALSAAILRPEASSSNAHRTGATSTTSRLLPHPIWARRYPGAAGEWLRGELARRASAAATQPNSVSGPTSSRNDREQADAEGNSTAGINTTPASAVPRAPYTMYRQMMAETGRNAVRNATLEGQRVSSRTRDEPLSQAPRSSSSSPWRVLQFPSLDPSTRNGSHLSSGQGSTVPATVQSHRNSSNSLAVPSNAAALAPTPPPGDATEDGRTVESTFSAATEPSTSTSASASASPDRNRAATLVARMAQASRERNNAALSRGSNAGGNDARSEARTTSSSRAVRGGMEYIRRLRALDGTATDWQNVGALNESRAVPARFEEPESPPRPQDVFPWYQSSDDDALPTSLDRMTLNDTQSPTENEFDPNGTSIDWYQMARARMSAQASLAGQDQDNDDPNGERTDADENSLNVRRRVVTSASGTGVSAMQRQRNRTARVMAEEDAPLRSNNLEAWNVVDGWTVIDQRPVSPVRRTRDEGSENVTTWFRGPAFSTSPLLMDRAVDDNSGREADPRRNRGAQADASLRVPHTSARTATDSSSFTEAWSSSPGRENRLAYSSLPQPNAFSRRSLPHQIGRSTLGVSNVPRTSTGSAFAPVRRAEYASGMMLEPSSLSARRSEEFSTHATTYREETPSPEPHLGNVGSGMRFRPMSAIGARLEEEFRARQDELRQRDERLRSEIARRRMELDQLRQRQGRIGRVIERNRRDPTSAHLRSSTVTSDPSAGLDSGGGSERNNAQNSQEGNFEYHEAVSLPADDVETEAVAEATPLLQRSTSGSASLVRRGAVRDSTYGLRPFASRRSMDVSQDYGAAGIR